MGGLEDTIWISHTVVPLLCDVVMGAVLDMEMADSSQILYLVLEEGGQNIWSLKCQALPKNIPHWSCDLGGLIK